MKRGERRVVHVPFRDFYNYPEDKRLPELFRKFKLDSSRPHDVVYNQAMKRYEITAYPAPGADTQP